MLLKSAKGELCVEVSSTGLSIVGLQYCGKPFMAPRGMYEADGALKLRGGSHPCVPVFGKAPKGSGFEGLPQHGWLRDLDVRLKRGERGDELLAGFELGGVEEYPWVIQGKASFRIVGENMLQIAYAFWRELDNVAGDAPFNFGLHHYWRNVGGVNVSFLSERGLLDRITVLGPYPEPRIFAHPQEIAIKVNDSGTVKMRLGANNVGTFEPRFVIWSDSSSYTCVEQVLDEPARFASSEGVFVRDCSNQLQVTSLLTFSR